MKCYDNNIQSLNSVYTRYQSDKAQLYEDHLVESPNFAGQVLCLSRLEETVNDVQLVIECVAEDLDAKSVLLEKISNLCSQDCVIVSNSLRLDMSKLAEKIKFKERFVGLRFLYPVYYISEVEITPHKETANWVTERLRTFLGQMGKTLFFRSGTEPLILTEEKREIRKLQRIEELRFSNGLPPLRQDTHLPELGRNINADINKLFLRRNPNQDFYSLNSETEKSLNNWPKPKNKVIEDLNESSGNGQDNDCAICMDKSRNSVLRPCNHMIICYECSMLLLNRQDNCPVCRVRIEEVIKIFMS